MNHQDVIDAIQLCALAYLQDQPLYPDTSLTVIDNKEWGVQGFVRQKGDTLIIAFRGSNSIQDWRVNLSAWKKRVPYDDCNPRIRVHAGFVDAYQSPGVRERILGLVGPQIRYIKVMGHSLGAAMSVLCAVDLQYHFPDRDFEVMLFGCPRVGNKAFKTSYNKRVFKTLRVENANDAVTKLPFSLWGYRHVGAKVHVGAWRLPLLIKPSDHHLDRYYSRVFTADWQ